MTPPPPPPPEVTDWVSIDSGDGFSPIWRQSITWTSADLQSIGPLGTNFSEIVIEIQTLSFYIHTWHVYGVEMYKFINSEEDKMNEKQVELSECMIAFHKIPQFLPLQGRSHLWRNIPRHRCLVFTNLHLLWVCIMLHVWSISYKISVASFLLYQLCQAILFLLQFGMRLSSSAADSSATFVLPDYVYMTR